MNPFKLLLLLFIAIPIFEIYLLIKVGSLIGAIPTILAIIGTAVLGAWLLRMQGISTFNRVQSNLQRGELPAIEMMEGLVLLIAGALLLTPGFFTDILGFAALIPTLRRAFIVWALKNSNIMHTMQQQNRTYESPDFQSHKESRSEHIVIEGEYKKDDK